MTMRLTFMRTVAVSVFLIVSARSLLAEQATVIHGVSLRSDPSTHTAPVGHLKKGSTVTLLEPQPKAGFYHVQTPDGTEGWVGVKFLSTESQTGAQPSSTSPSGTAPPSGTVSPSGTASGAESTACDPSLADHVYNPQRLVVKNACISVTGTIVDATSGKKPDGVRHEQDGDTHGWLKLDPEFQNLLNAGNQSDEGGNMVFEIVCFFPVTQQDAKASCTGYKSPLQIPPIGSHIRVVGAYVQDTNHARWMEIHPVTSITVIP
jgi:hypothetical protein